MIDTRKYIMLVFERKQAQPIVSDALFTWKQRKPSKKVTLASGSKIGEPLYMRQGNPTARAMLPGRVTLPMRTWLLNLRYWRRNDLASYCIMLCLKTFLAAFQSFFYCISKLFLLHFQSFSSTAFFSLSFFKIWPKWYGIFNWL